MVADTSAELHSMADRIGVARRWCQNNGMPGEHYDICLSKRALAVTAGAQEVTMRRVAEITYARKRAAALGQRAADSIAEQLRITP
jgi:hypothetical protein